MGIVRLTSFEVKSHLGANDPANNDKERSNQESNLDRRTDSNTHGEIHLVTDSNNNSGDVLCGVANNGDQDQTDKRPADSGGCYEVVDAVNEVIGADSDKHSSHNQDGHGSDGANGGLFRLNFLIAFVLVLGIEEVAVGSELENEVEDVKSEKNDSGTARECKNALGLLLGATLIENSIELEKLVKFSNGGISTYSSGDDERGRRQGHERASRLGCSRRKDLLASVARLASVNDTAEQEAHSHHQEEVRKNAAKH